MKTYLTLFFTTTLSLILSGCFSNYDAPDNQPTASLTLSTNADKLRVQVFNDKQCRKSPHGSRLAYFSGKEFDNHDGTTKPISAEREFVFTFTQDTTERYKCNITLVFTPEMGQSYHAKYNLVEGRKCNAQVYREINKHTGEIYLEPEPTSTKSPVSCINNITG